MVWKRSWPAVSLPRQLRRQTPDVQIKWGHLHELWATTAQFCCTSRR